MVIPEDIQNQLDLAARSQFVVIGDKDIVILKHISAPSLDEFDGLIKNVRKQAKAAGLKKSDIDKAVKKARS